MSLKAEHWKCALVYGLGISGKAAARLLRSRAVEVVGMDRRAAEDLELGDLASDPGVELHLGEEPELLPAGVDALVISPGVPPGQPLLLAARQAGLPIVAEVELASWYLSGPIVGITGSNGKSTTTALTGELLRASGFDVEVCGNIGLPLSACVEGEAGRIFVTELSSFQLEGIDGLRPRAAGLLNLAADHLDWHGGEDAYFAAKKAIFRNQTADDSAVLNADDSRVAAIETEAHRRAFSRTAPVQDGCYVEGDIVVEVAPGEAPRALFSCDDLALEGEHNLENAMAAALLSRAMGADGSAFPAALALFRGLPHRVEQVGDRLGVKWIDDSKATNFAATLRSLDAFPDRSVHLILGGRNKGGDAALLAEVAGRKVKRIYLVGEAAEDFRSALAGIVPCEMAVHLPQAVDSAARRAVEGDVVLLSPACASFDQYRNFNERGDHFQQLVGALNG
ncbi:MAG: UDP-N-acetylmuramoyl-L-alanine--D-glutamate ligase [Thermoanaerobaculia bacterium]